MTKLCPKCARCCEKGEVIKLQNRVFMKPLITVLIIASLLFSCQVSARLGSYERSVSTGEKELPLDWKVKFEYGISATVSHPSTLTPGETTDWTVSLKGGTLETSVYLPPPPSPLPPLPPSPFSKWYSLPSLPVQIGESVPITSEGITVEPTLTISASLSVSGPATLDAGSLFWESDGSKTFKVTANSDAEMGRTVKVTINAETEIHTTITYSGIPLTRPPTHQSRELPIQPNL